jgi:hypothetical protein
LPLQREVKVPRCLLPNSSRRSWQNELTDRVQQGKGMDVIDKREGKHTLTEEQVETKYGPRIRALAIDGTTTQAGPAAAGQHAHGSPFCMIRARS